MNTLLPMTMTLRNMRPDPNLPEHDTATPQHKKVGGFFAETLMPGQRAPYSA